MTETLAALNAQLASIGANAGVTIEPINMLAEVNAAREEMLSSLPGLPEQLQNVKESIASFKTHLALSEMSGTDIMAGAQGLVTEFRAAMQEQEKDMRIYANVKIQQEYKKMMDRMLESIDRQNASVAQQAEAAALSAGFVKAGKDYIKQGKLVSTAVGIVEGYNWFDGKAAMSAELAAIGSDYGADPRAAHLSSFLDEADTVEVEAYFHTQTLILQKAMEKLMGTGTTMERKLADGKGKDDEKILGKFGMWVGRPAGSSDTSKAVEGATPYADDKTKKEAKLGEDITNLDIIKYLSDPGFGELGSGGNRHETTGAWLGFYTKLDAVSKMIDGKDRDRTERLAGSVDPVTATINQFNPLVMLSNAYQNVRIGSEVNGKGSGYMIEAQLMAMTKAPLSLVGKLLMTAGIGIMAGAGWTGIGALIGAAVTAVGFIADYTANSMHVDAKSGKHGIQSTDQAAIATTIDLGMSFIPGANEANPSLGWRDGVNIASSTIQGGMQYDEKGHLTKQFNWDGAVIGGLSASAGTVARLEGGNKTAQFFATDGTSTVLSTGQQYAKYSNGEENYYSDLASPGMERLGSLGTGLGMALYADYGNQANKNDQTRRTADNLNGWGFRRDEEEVAWESYDGVEGGLSDYGGDSGPLSGSLMLANTTPDYQIKLSPLLPPGYTDGSSDSVDDDGKSCSPKQPGRFESEVNRIRNESGQISSGVTGEIMGGQPGGGGYAGMVRDAIRRALMEAKWGKQASESYQKGFKNMGNSGMGRGFKNAVYYTLTLPQRAARLYTRYTSAQSDLGDILDQQLRAMDDERAMERERERQALLNAITNPYEYAGAADSYDENEKGGEALTQMMMDWGLAVGGEALGASRTARLARLAPRAEEYVSFADDLVEHVIRGDGVSQKGGVSGAHNLDEFLKYSDHFRVVSMKAHPTIEGVYEIEYQMKAMARGNTGLTGGYKAEVLTKTVYDPRIISNKTFLQWGKEAAAQAERLGPGSTEWLGFAQNGLEFRGRYELSGAIRTFYPSFD